LYEDVDGDGRLSVVEYLENTDPLKRDYSSQEVRLTNGGELYLEIKQRIGHDQVYLSVERSGDFELWENEEVEYRGRINNGDGSETVRFRINDSLELFNSGQFLRLSVSDSPEPK
jgi:hypothetical protein